MPDDEWWLTDLKRVTSPIFGLMSIDLTGEGVQELIVLTMKGVHILQVSTYLL